MTSTILRRLFQTAIAVLLMSALVFSGLYLVGDPISMLASPEASELERAAIRQHLGLDQPLWRQYIIFLSQAIHLDFGTSFLNGESTYACHPRDRDSSHALITAFGCAFGNLRGALPEWIGGS